MTASDPKRTSIPIGEYIKLDNNLGSPGSFLACTFLRFLSTGSGKVNESMVIRTATLVVCLLCFAAPKLTIAAESEYLHPFLHRGFSLDVGVFFPDRHLDLNVNGTVGGINEEIDFDQDFQLGSADETFAAEISWRFRGKWSVVGQFFKTSDSASVVLDEDIE